MNETAPGAEGLPIGLMDKVGRSARLRARLAEPAILVVPGAFDCISARLVERAGFEAIYFSGAGMSMSMLGVPDLGLVSFAEMLERVRRMADVVTLPVIVDADTGYGGPLNVIRTVRELERAGVSCIQIEDQQWPKRCGHELGRVVVGVDEMVARIKAATDARRDEATLIMARTDARTTEGIEAALDRAEAYQEAGADVLFVESPESAEEMRRINERLRVPTLANMVEGGRTPMRPAAELEKIGYDIAIFPGMLARVMAKAGERALAALRQAGWSDGLRDDMFDHRELFDLFEYARWTGTEARYGSR